MVTVVLLGIATCSMLANRLAKHPQFVNKAHFHSVLVLCHSERVWSRFIPRSNRLWERDRSADAISSEPMAGQFGRAAPRPDSILASDFPLCTYFEFPILPITADGPDLANTSRDPGKI